MKAVLFLLACCLIFVSCETEEKEDQSLSEILSNGILVRNLREAERNQKKEKRAKKGGKKKNGKRAENKKNGRKSGNKKKARKSANEKKARKSGNKKKARKSANKKKARKSANKKKARKSGNKKKTRKSANKKKARKSKKKGRKQKKGKTGRKAKNVSPRATATCNGTALGSTCLTNLISALKYERDAVANFMNQKARAESFKKLIGSKGGKNDTFGNSTTYLLTALGGNVSNLTCGSQNTSGADAIMTYKALTNCSTAVSAACMVPNTTVNFTQLDTCKTYYENVQSTNKKCFEMTMKKSTNGTAVCECWKGAAEAVATAKSKSSSCSANTAQSDMKDLKNTCLAAFGVCKKAEDASVSFILKCSTDSSSSNSSVTVSSNSTSSNSTSGGRAQRLRL